MSCLVGVNGALLLVIITVMITLKHIAVILYLLGGGREGGGQVGANRSSDQCIFCIASLCM